MANIIVTGDITRTKNFTDEYIRIHGIQPYEVEIFSESVKVEHARMIRKSLTLKYDGQKLFILTGEVTPECQNALLKCIEESKENIHFIFCIENEEQLLETVRSRCNIKYVGKELQIDAGLGSILRDLCEKRLGWYEIDALCEYVKLNGFGSLLIAMRYLMLENVNDKQVVCDYHAYCKRLLQYAPLSTNNNVSEKIVIESVFMPAS